MANLINLTAQLVSAHSSNTQMTTDDLYKEIEKVHATLKALESGASVVAPEQPKQLTIKQAFKKDEVFCMICGKGFKTLKRHIAQAHDLKPGQYRKQFSIPSSQSLVAKSYSESRKKAAEDRGLAGVLAKSREVRAAAKKAAAPVEKTKATAATKKKSVLAAKKTAAPVEKTKAPVPMIRDKSSVPAIKVKAPVPAKIKVAKAPVKTKKTPDVKPAPKATK